MAFFRDIKEDINVILEQDPAARTGLEILLCYPGIWALIWHKPAHWLYRHNMKMLAEDNIAADEMVHWYTFGCSDRKTLLHRSRHGCRDRRDRGSRR